MEENSSTSKRTVGLHVIFIYPTASELMEADSFFSDVESFQEERREKHVTLLLETQSCHYCLLPLHRQGVRPVYQSIHLRNFWCWNCTSPKGLLADELRTATDEHLISK